MRKLTIYIARHRKSTPMCPAHSQPCSNCLSVINKLGIKKIVYVDAFGEVKKKLSKNYHTDYVCPGYKELARLNIKAD